MASLPCTHAQAENRGAQLLPALTAIMYSGGAGECSMDERLWAPSVTNRGMGARPRDGNALYVSTALRASRGRVHSSVAN